VVEVGADHVARVHRLDRVRRALGDQPLDLVAQRGDRGAVQGLGADQELEAVVLGWVVAAGDHHGRGGREVVGREVQHRGRDHADVDHLGVDAQPVGQRAEQPRRVDPRIAADDDRPASRGGLGRQRGPQRAHGGVIEIAIRDAADVVLSKHGRVHGS
jgi:hypothetical protein